MTQQPGFFFIAQVVNNHGDRFHPLRIGWCCSPPNGLKIIQIAINGGSIRSPTGDQVLQQKERMGILRENVGPTLGRVP